MKGTFFHKPLEFRLSVDGESWQQGDSIGGLLTVKNHSADALPSAGISVCLARGVLRKVHQKTADAFDVVSQAPIPSTAGADIPAGGELSFPWKLDTDRNFPITDTVSSPFLLYGREISAESAANANAALVIGQLQIPVVPYEVVIQFLDVFKTGFRFVAKGTKWSKGFVDAKLTPPDSRGFASLEQLTVSFHFEDETLQVGYEFKRKKVEASAASVDLKKEKTTFEQSYDRALYRTPSGRFDHERVEKEIRGILDQVESKTLL